MNKKYIDEKEIGANSLKDSHRAVYSGQLEHPPPPPLEILPRFLRTFPRFPLFMKSFIKFFAVFQTWSKIFPIPQMARI